MVKTVETEIDIKLQIENCEYDDQLTELIK